MIERTENAYPSHIKLFIEQEQHKKSVANDLIKVFSNEIKEVLFPDEYWYIVPKSNDKLGALSGYLPLFQDFLNAYFVEDKLSTHQERRDFEHKVNQYDEKNGTQFHKFLDNQKMGRNKLSVKSVFETVFYEKNLFNIDKDFRNSIPDDLKSKILNFDIGELYDESDKVKPKIYKLDQVLRKILLWMEGEGYINIYRFYILEQKGSNEIPD